MLNDSLTTVNGAFHGKTGIHPFYVDIITKSTKNFSRLFLNANPTSLIPHAIQESLELHSVHYVDYSRLPVNENQPFYG